MRNILTRMQELIDHVSHLDEDEQEFFYSHLSYITHEMQQFKYHSGRSGREIIAYQIALTLEWCRKVGHARQDLEGYIKQVERASNVIKGTASRPNDDGMEKTFQMLGKMQLEICPVFRGLMHFGARLSN